MFRNGGKGRWDFCLNRLGIVLKLGIRWSRLRWLGVLLFFGKCGFGFNGYFKEEFLVEFFVIVEGRNISREMFKFSRIIKKRLLLFSKRFLYWGEEG